MGNYNPHAPQILGEEWVPVRDENTQLTPNANLVELGHQFTTAAARTLDEARFYVNDMDVLTDRGQTFMAAIYPAGAEADSGPVRSVTIPCNFVAMSGGTVSSGVPDAVTALMTPSSASGISLNTGAADTGLILSFAVSQYTYLTGKRILGVRFHFGVAASSDIVGPTRDASTSQIVVATDVALNSGADPQALFGRLRENGLDEASFGEINQFWTANSPNATTDRVPWTYAQLQRFDATATRLFTKIETGTNRGTTASSSCYIYYAALEVLYCDEKRVAVGATQYGTTNTSHSLGNEMIFGANSILMHDPSTGALLPSLGAGAWSLVLSSADVGGLNDNQAQTTSAYPNLNALRQLASIPNHNGVRVNIPTPMNENVVGQSFTREVIDILPQLSLHTTGGVITETHVYGRVTDAQLFGTVTATQDIQDANANGTTSWPQVRFYARRFGRTTVPLLLESPNITSPVGSQITLTPDEWDALPEVIDGYKEITKRFATPPSMGAGTNPIWRFSALGELVSNRWEVRGALAPALSGVGGNRLNQVIAADRLDTATYGAPTAGNTINEGWLPGSTTPVTVTTDDPAADICLVFSQDPATITGFTVTPSTQSLTGFAECGSGPCCIPTALNFNRITWNLPTNTAITLDDWNRTVTTGYGTAISGGAWAYSDAFAQYNIIGAERAAIKPAVANNQIFAFLANGGRDVEIVATIAVTGTTTGTVRGGLVSRYTDANNNYHALIQTDSTGATILNLIQTVGGSGTAVSNVSVPFTTYGGGRVKMKFLTQTWGTAGVMLKVKAWPITDVEPDIWHIEVNVTSGALTGTGVGISGRNSGAEVLASVLYDDFTAGPPRYWFNSYELQRKDDITDWQTIMRSTNVTTTVFSDFEARAGMTSSYRIRQWNDLLFAGQWSITGTGAVPEPGVTLPSCGTNRRGVLIFTTNADQTGASNLAYAMTWDNNVVENFGFPEVDTLTVDRYLDRDYQVAFHGTERGGEQFSRRLLLANAAVALPRLANMRSLRDLAWDDVPYVCVRDDIGDRWFATIVVSGGEVRRGRRLYNANVAIIETTGTAAEVDP